MARAQELTQETFIRAYRALARGERWDNPRAWLYRTASRLATDDYRHRTVFQWLPLSATKHDPLSGIEAGLLQQMAVRTALETLPPKYRIPLVLYVCEGFTVTDIAMMLGLTASAVKMRLSRAREMFRRAYEEEA